MRFIRLWLLIPLLLAWGALPTYGQTATPTNTPTPAPTPKVAGGGCLIDIKQVDWAYQTLTGTDAVTVVDAAASGKKHCLTSILLSGAASSVVTLYDNATPMFTVQGTFSEQYGFCGPCVSGPIILDQSGAGVATVTLGLVGKK